MSYLKTIQNAANLRSSTGGTIIVAVNALKSNFFLFFLQINILIKVFKNPGTFNSIMPIHGKMGKGLRRTQLLHKKIPKFFSTWAAVIIFRRNVYITRGKFSRSVDFFVR